MPVDNRIQVRITTTILWTMKKVKKIDLRRLRRAGDGR